MDLLLKQLQIRDGSVETSVSDESASQKLQRDLELQMEHVRHLSKQYASDHITADTRNAMLNARITVLERQREEDKQMATEKNKNIQTLQDEMFTLQVTDQVA